MIIRSVLPLMLVMGASAQQQSGIVGRVADGSTGQPLKGAHIRLNSGGSRDAEAPVYGARSDSDGRFSISPMPSGSYRLRVDLRGYFYVPKSYTVILKPGEAIDNFRIELTPQAILSGRVLDEQGQPVEYAGVMVRIASSKDVALEVALRDCCLPMGQATGADGEFRIAVPPGKFRLEASGRPNAEILSDGTLGRSADATSEPVAVEARPGKETSGIEIRIPRKKLYSIRGNATGAPSGAQVNVYVGGRYGGSDDEVVASKDGSFSVADVPEGAYYLHAECCGAEAPLRSARREIYLDADVANVSLALVPPITLSGGLVGAPNAAVRLESPREFRESELAAGVSPHGAFRFDRVQPDDYVLTVRPIPEDDFIRSVELDGDRVTDRSADTRIPRGPTGPAFLVPLNLSKATGAAALRIVIAKGARLSGTVEGKSGPVTDNLGGVMLVPEDNRALEFHRNLYAQVDSHGGYAFYGVPPGRYHVVAQHSQESDGDDSEDAWRKRVEGSEIVELHEGERVTKDLKVAGRDGKNP